jgi:hypothetical protein
MRSNIWSASTASRHRALARASLQRVTPHTLRHSTAMDLLHHGVDQAVIALWRTRVGRDHPDLHPRRHADEGKRPSLASPLRQRQRAASSPTTNSSHSSKGSDYAEPPHGQNSANRPQRRPCGIIPVTALWPSSWKAVRCQLIGSKYACGGGTCTKSPDGL